jgi:peptide-N4-(N-acetyl-beta-glucosaminyl)asparagine amidase
MDSCENARDQHLLYDVGWGKKQSYILAFSIDGAQDVSRGYIKDFEASISRRNRASEEDLQLALAEVTRRRRLGLSAQKLQELEREDKGELEFLQGKKEPEESLPARESGTAEWKAARGEDGSGGKSQCDH